MIYQNINKRDNLINDVFNVNFNDGAYVEIKSGGEQEFLVEFINTDTGEILHTTNLRPGYWVKTVKKYFVNWKINIYKENKLVHQHLFDCTNKNIYVIIDSYSLGDNIAWFPYIEEFRKKHNCTVYVNTNYTNLFEENYPEIKFVTPNMTIKDLYATYKIGWYYHENQIDLNKNKILVNTKPFQQTSSEILGLGFSEIKPNVKTSPNIKKEKQVSIAIHASAQAKYWNNPTGWQEVVDYLNGLGYKVKLLSREENGHAGNYHPTGVEQLTNGSIEDVITELQKSEFFIGVGSGLSWLSWSVNVPSILISGFSEPFCEMRGNIKRIYNDTESCKGCFTHHKFDPTDWSWCPLHKGTDREFECSKSITSNDVIQKIHEIITPKVKSLI